jgi:3-phosphoglycerate kinase
VAVFNKKTIEDVDINGRVVLVRVDYNVPLNDKGEITDNYRIATSLPTIRYLLGHGAKRVVLVSHLGRPGGRVDSKYSLGVVADCLRELLSGTQVEFIKFVPGVAGGSSEFLDKVASSSSGSVILLENLRFNPGEEANSEAFARDLVQLTDADLFVQDGFGVLHRESATTNAITRLLPSVAGLLVENEVKALQKAIYDPMRPFLSINGGAKVSDKVGILSNLMSLADSMLIGGAMANCFLKYSGNDVGVSKVEEGQGSALNTFFATRAARRIPLFLPQDVLTVKEIIATAKTEVKPVSKLAKDDIIVDIGPKTTELFLREIEKASTVVWNGNLGITEIEPFANGSKAVAEAIGRKQGALTIIGGGDTAGFVRGLMQQDSSLRYSLISTGGGVALDFIAGKPLPGLVSLQDR